MLSGATFRNSLGFKPTDVALSTNKITVTSHGLSDTNSIRFNSTGNLPAPLEPDTDYFVLNKTTNDFEVAATSGGTAIDLTSVGSGAHTDGTVTDPTKITFRMAEPFEGLIEHGIRGEAFELNHDRDIRLRHTPNSFSKIKRGWVVNWITKLRLGGPPRSDCLQTR